MADQPKKCAHPSCNCQAPEHDKYCSQYCSDASDTTELTCQCHHPACESGASPISG